MKYWDELKKQEQVREREREGKMYGGKREKRELESRKEHWRERETEE